MPDDNGKASSAKAALRLAAQRGGAQVSSPGHVLSFSSWFALYARRTDITMLTLELVAINCAYMLKLNFRKPCLPIGGSPDAALQASASALRDDSLLIRVLQLIDVGSANGMVMHTGSGRSMGH